MIKVIKRGFYIYMAKIHYNAMQSLRDRYSCGHSLACFINPKIAHHEARLNYWISKAKRMDNDTHLDTK